MKLIIEADEVEWLVSEFVLNEMNIIELGTMPKVTFIPDKNQFIVEHGERDALV